MAFLQILVRHDLYSSWFCPAFVQLTWLARSWLTVLRRPLPPNALIKCFLLSLRTLSVTLIYVIGKGIFFNGLSKLTFMPWRRVEKCRYSSTILHLGSRWRRVVSLTPRPLYPRGKSRRTRWVGSWVGHKAGLDSRKKRKLCLYWNRTSILLSKSVVRCYPACY
jgi:hypothetical protein